MPPLRHSRRDEPRANSTPWGRSFLAVACLVLLGAHSAAAAVADTSDSAINVHGSYWYDWGWYGAYPRKSYESFGAESPLINIVKQDERCDDSLTFFEPRGAYVETPGPVVIDNDGNLIWTETKWGQAMDLKVQRYKGKDYITFWRGVDRGGFAGGEGSYIMLDDKYEVFMEVKPIGGLTGDLHEFRITDEDTIIMTMYESTKGDMHEYGMDEGWIFDCLFQEINLETGELIFEWRASDVYPIHESMQPLFNTGGYPDNGFDFFHINSVDKDANGDYLISARHMCAVACISHVDGSILWQLGGVRNSFTDLSDGAATNFTWNHHAAWHSSTTLTIFDNGSNGEVVSAAHSRGIMVEVDLDKMTAKAIHQYMPPLDLLTPSQGSVQILPNDNVLVGWGHTPAFTEYTMDGEVLCDTHFGVIWFSNFGWSKSYRTFKFPWVGRPNTLPSVAVRPNKGAVFVSWNGATEVDRWLLQSGGSSDEDAEFRHHEDVPKTTFETRIPIPADARQYLRVAALDRNGDVLAYSKPVSRDERTVIKLTDAPWRGWKPEPFTIFMWSLSAFVVLVAAVYRFRGLLTRAVRRAVGRGVTVHRYEPLPAK